VGFGRPLKDDKEEEHMRFTGWKGTAAIALFCFVVGLLIGWFLIGWLLWPVKWSETDPVDLRESVQRDYVAMVADSYTVTRDIQAARQRLSSLPEADVSRILGELHAGYTKQGRGAEAQRIKDLANNLNIKPVQVTPAGTGAPQQTPAASPGAPTATPTPEPGSGSSLWTTVLAVCGILLAVVVLVAGAALGMSYARRKRASSQAKSVQAAVAPEAAIGPLDEGTPALGTFVTTYNMGDKHYDDCFPIETRADEFLGECGVGISEIVGEGDLTAATAFEVWLFDKSDIRTVTKVLMSEYAFNDEELRAKLSPKGELILAQPGEVITLETAALQVQAEIKELAYAAGGGPAQSQFARLMMELTAQAKSAGAADTEA
jgi:hypothetical protein